MFHFRLFMSILLRVLFYCGPSILTWHNFVSLFWEQLVGLNLILHIDFYAMLSIVFTLWFIMFHCCCYEMLRAIVAASWWWTHRGRVPLCLSPKYPGTHRLVITIKMDPIEIGFLMNLRLISSLSVFLSVGIWWFCNEKSLAGTGVPAIFRSPNQATSD